MGHRKEMQKLRAPAFDTMLEQGYPRNLYIGGKPMRGYDAHDMRFENFNAEPECSSKVRKTNLPPWTPSSPGKSKTMNFSLTSYCNNSYMPDPAAVSAKLDIGISSFDTSCGRD